jgi:hypothetical protein
MGYLDNSTIVVDAVLTKQGRKLLALGQGLNISYFTLTDTGVDYSLWNPDHPSGSAYYGEAIENLPNLEALPNSAYFMRNNLLSYARDTVRMPYVMIGTSGIGQTASYEWSEGQITGIDLIVTLKNVTAGESVGWQVVVPDSTLVTIVGNWTAAAIGGNVQQYLNEQDIANAVVYDAGPAGDTPVGIHIDRVNTTSTRTIILTFISKSTGAYKHLNLTMPKYPNTDTNI